MGEKFNCYKCGRELNMLGDRFCCKRLQGSLGESRGKVVKEKSIKRSKRSVKKRRSKRKSMPVDLRYSILKRDGHRCTLCGSKKKLHVHHIKRVADGGTNDPNNLKTLCDICHAEEHRGEAVYNIMIKSFFVYENITS